MAGETCGELSLSPTWNDWTFDGNGHFTGKADCRGIYTITHPMDVSHEGYYGQVSRAVTLPADWNGSVFLSLLVTDDHHGVGVHREFQQSSGGGFFRGASFSAGADR